MKDTNKKTKNENDKEKEKLTPLAQELEAKAKKRTIIVVCVVAVIVVAFSIYYFALGGRYNGKYELSSVTISGMTVESENFAEVFGDQGYLTMVVKGESCTFEGDLIESFVGDEHKIKIDKNTVTLDFAVGADFSGTYEKGKIVIDIGGMYLSFEK